jgi:hypothetical protein
MSQSTHNAPLQSFRMNNVSVSVFANESTTDGQSQTYFRAKVDKRYRDSKTGQWNSSNSFSADELLRLQHLIGRAVEFMSAKPAEDHDRGSDDSPEPARGQAAGRRAAR